MLKITVPYFELLNYNYNIIIEFIISVDLKAFIKGREKFLNDIFSKEREEDLKNFVHECVGLSLNAAT